MNAIKITLSAIVALQLTALSAQRNVCNLVPDGAHHTEPVPVTAVPPDVSPFPPEVPPGNNEYRNIIWVHGLGGSEESWAEAAAATQFGASITSPLHVKYKARKAICRVPAYSETDFLTAVDEFYQMSLPPATPGGDNSRDFFIAHGQGGLVARQLDKMIAEGVNAPDYQRKINGLVTFNTSHGGAPILNSLDAGLLNEFSIDACNGFLTPRAAELVNKLPDFVQLFVNAGTLPALQDFCSGNINVLPSFLNDLTAGTTLDYRVGAPLLDDLNTFENPVMPKVCFTGVEYGNGETALAPKQLLWRTVSSLDKVDNGPAFSRDDDNYFVNVMNGERASMAARREQLLSDIQALRDRYEEDCDFWSHPFNLMFCESGFFTAINDKIEALKETERAIEWMDKVDDQWKIIIGARQESISYNCMYVDALGIETAMYNVSDPAQCPVGEEYYVAPVVGATVTASDGIVPIQSQQAFPGVNQIIQLEQMNHFQVRNSRATGEALIDLFDGLYGQFFLTLEK